MTGPRPWSLGGEPPHPSRPAEPDPEPLDPEDDLAAEALRLAAEREDLIAQGVDPADLVPLDPDLVPPGDTADVDPDE